MIIPHKKYFIFYIYFTTLLVISESYTKWIVDYDIIAFFLNIVKNKC